MYTDLLVITFGVRQVEGPWEAEAAIWPLGGDGIMIFLVAGLDILVVHALRLGIIDRRAPAATGRASCWSIPWGEGCLFVLGRLVHRDGHSKEGLHDVHLWLP